MNIKTCPSYTKILNLDHSFLWAEYTGYDDDELMWPHNSIFKIIKSFDKEFCKYILYGCTLKRIFQSCYPPLFKLYSVVNHFLPFLCEIETIDVANS